MTELYISNNINTTTEQHHINKETIIINKVITIERLFIIIIIL